MHAFDENEKLVKFAKVEDVITHFVDVRLRYYVERKKHKIVELERITRKLSNIARFITEMLEDKIDLRRKKSVEVNTILKEKGYASEADDQDAAAAGSYNYLVKLPMDSVTEENVAKKIKDRDEKIKELELLKATSEEQLWLNELNILREKYLAFNKKNNNNNNSGDNEVSETVKIIKKKKLVVVKK